MRSSTIAPAPRAARSALAADLGAIDESIRAQESQIQTLRNMLEFRKQQFGLLSEQLKNLRLSI